MFLSKHSNGYYYIYFLNDKGKRNSLSTKTKIKNEALKFLSRFEKEIEGRRIKKLQLLTLDEYCNYFLSCSKQIHTQKTYEGYSHSLKRLNEYFAEINIAEITLSNLNKYFEHRLLTSTIFMARKDLICFNSLFNKAISEGYLINNPCRGIKRFRIPQKQPLFFSESEFDILLNAITNKDLKDMVLFAVQTGLRQMELITLQWNQINLRDKILTLTNQNAITKSKRIRTIPLSLKALQVLIERRQNLTLEMVFTFMGKPWNQDSLGYQFKRSVLKAEINSKLNFHSLRHTFASWLVQRGVSIFQVSKLLGHSRIETTEIYSHLRAEDLRNAIDKLSSY